MAWFWEGFHQYDPLHPLYDTDHDRSLCIPIMTHGDEGKGLKSQSFMVQSWQLVMSFKGPKFTNNSGNLGCTAWEVFIYIYIWW